jgi:hypothetical protein
VLAEAIAAQAAVPARVLSMLERVRAKEAATDDAAKRRAALLGTFAVAQAPRFAGGLAHAEAQLVHALAAAREMRNPAVYDEQRHKGGGELKELLHQLQLALELILSEVGGDWETMARNEERPVSFHHGSERPFRNVK